MKTYPLISPAAFLRLLRRTPTPPMTAPNLRHAAARHPKSPTPKRLLVRPGFPPSRYLKLQISEFLPNARTSPAGPRLQPPKSHLTLHSPTCASSREGGAGERTIDLVR
ncbi:hypothetical protein VPH35_123148 [Triticum aestivum]